MDRMERKLQKIGQKLDAYGSDDGVLKKPKHWQTFYNLKMAEIAISEEVDNAILARFRHWL